MVLCCVIMMHERGTVLVEEILYHHVLFAAFKRNLVIPLASLKVISVAKRSVFSDKATQEMITNSQNFSVLQRTRMRPKSVLSLLVEDSSVAQSHQQRKLELESEAVQWIHIYSARRRC